LLQAQALAAKQVMTVSERSVERAGMNMVESSRRASRGSRGKAETAVCAPGWAKRPNAAQLSVLPEKFHWFAFASLFFVILELILKNTVLKSLSFER
jgi:hypothetical protein